MSEPGSPIKPTDGPDWVTLTAVRRVAAAARGDIYHLIQPIIGQMRLAAHKGDRIHPDQLDYWIDRLYTALAVADAFGDDEARAELAMKHGLGTPARPS